MSAFRLYSVIEAAAGREGYPPEWDLIPGTGLGQNGVGIKHLVRERAGNRCERCGHPYMALMGEWSPCDERCAHDGPTRKRPMHTAGIPEYGHITEAQWRILTVHHLNEVKHDCRWWNLVALCQRCHLNIQRRVRMERPWPWPHTGWFKPYAAGFYASHFGGEELTREQTMARLDELLAMGARESAVERMPI